jgi:2'-5' RNA ligase
VPGASENASIRAFVAVEIPDDVKDEICRLISHFSHKGYPVHWVRRENLHLTLVFLGENPPEFTAKVKAQLARAAAETAGFALGMKGLGVFPSERSPRVIWLGVEPGKTELTALAACVLRELVTIGFIPEKRPFSAHLTIGRVKEPLPDVRSILERECVSRAFPVDEVVLFQSHLRPTGPVYERLGQYRFTAGS